MNLASRVDGVNTAGNEKLAKTNTMWITISIAVLLGSVTSTVEGQLGVLEYANETYIYPVFVQNYTESKRICKGFEADLAVLDDGTVRNTSILKRKSVQGNELWVKENSNAKRSDCKFVNIQTGISGRENCSVKLPYICKGRTWSNLTVWSGGIIGFSATKLRSQFGSTICDTKREGLMGQLVTITWGKLQDVLSNYKQDHDYYINKDNRNASLTNGYQNWALERSPTQGNSSCMQMKRDGKWDNAGCLQYKYFICQWMRTPSTTTVQETTKPPTRMPEGKATTQITSKMAQETSQKADTKTETVAMTSTSGSAIISVSKVMSLILSLTALTHVL